MTSRLETSMSEVNPCIKCAHHRWPLCIQCEPSLRADFSHGFQEFPTQGESEDYKTKSNVAAHPKIKNSNLILVVPGCKEF